MTQGAGPGPGLMGDGSQWAVDQASSSEADTGTTSSSTESGTTDDKKNAAVRGSIPVFASGLALLLTLAVAL
jgi:1,3-beta-glucanosyltransferase GAS5